MRKIACGLYWGSVVPAALFLGLLIIGAYGVGSRAWAHPAEVVIPAPFTEEGMLAAHGVIPVPPPPPPPDHFLCYRIMGDPAGVIVDLKDQFDVERDITVKDPRMLCNPSQKKHDGKTTEIKNPTVHLTGFAITDEVVPRTVTVKNQFGEQVLSLKNPKILLVPTEKNGELPPHVVPAGDDHLVTDPERTYQDIQIPPDFFGHGSDPFTGRIRLQGTPIPSAAAADTIIRRLEDVSLPPPFPSSATVPIEIVALSLVSVEPIRVTYGGMPLWQEFWDVHVSLAPKQSPSSMTITRKDASGGTFDSTLQVTPILMFRRNDGAMRTMDNLPPITFRASGVAWDQTSPSHVVGIDHFKCYEAMGMPIDKMVDLKDQFGSEPMTRVRVPKFFCNPVEKTRRDTGEVTGILHPKDHLTCYSTESNVDKRGINIKTQFGTQRVKIRKPVPRLLCVPSDKTAFTSGG